MVKNEEGPEGEAAGHHGRGVSPVESPISTLPFDPNPGRASQIDDGGERQGQALSTEHEKDEFYLASTPQTPRLHPSPSRAIDQNAEMEIDEGPTTEIQSIMEQFQDGNEKEDGESANTEADEERALEVPVNHPPRRSSLGPLHDTVLEYGNGVTPSTEVGTTYNQPQKVTHSYSRGHASNGISPIGISNLSPSARFGSIDSNAPLSPHSATSLHKELPPAPDPEPDLPFDFHRFLEQLRHRTADPVAKYLRSFLTEFGKKPWMAHEQVKFINDFLTFIAKKMAFCDVWRGISDAEFDNAREGMEKLVMNRLYAQTFSPAILPTTLLPDAIGKSRNPEKVFGRVRRGQHQEDIERDDILSQKIRIYGWVKEQHLDITPVGRSGIRLLNLAQQGRPAKFDALMPS